METACFLLLSPIRTSLSQTYTMAEEFSILEPATPEAGNDEASGAKLNIPVMPNSAVDLSCGTQNALALSAFETARWDNQKGHCLNSERW